MPNSCTGAMVVLFGAAHSVHSSSRSLRQLTRPDTLSHANKLSQELQNQPPHPSSMFQDGLDIQSRYDWVQGARHSSLANGIGGSWRRSTYLFFLSGSAAARSFAISAFYQSGYRFHHTPRNHAAALLPQLLRGGGLALPRGGQMLLGLLKH